MWLGKFHKNLYYDKFFSKSDNKCNLQTQNIIGNLIDLNIYLRNPEGFI